MINDMSFMSHIFSVKIFHENVSNLIPTSVVAWSANVLDSVYAKILVP